MRMMTKDEISLNGQMIMLYGAPGTGKTTSIIQSAPVPLLYIQTEPRSLKPSIDAANRPDLDIEVAVYEDWNGLMEFIANGKNFDAFKTIVLDSFSALMNIALAAEIEDESFEARESKEKAIKPLIGQVKMSMEGYGGLASQMFRLTALLGKLSRAGKIVIVTALLQESPKWDRALAAAPALKGREYPVNCPGFFDLIGLVEPRTNGDGKVIYPPRVRFRSPDDSFLAKWTGVGEKTEGPLNISKILRLEVKENEIRQHAEG